MQKHFKKNHTWKTSSKNARPNFNVEQDLIYCSLLLITLLQRIMVGLLSSCESLQTFGYPVRTHKKHLLLSLFRVIRLNRKLQSDRLALSWVLIKKTEWAWKDRLINRHRQNLLLITSHRWQYQHAQQCKFCWVTATELMQFVIEGSRRWSCERSSKTNCWFCANFFWTQVEK